MASHLSDVGFDFKEENFYDDFLEMLDENMHNTSTEISMNGKDYVVVFVDSDIEFWLPIGPDRTIDPMEFELHYNTHKWIEVVKPYWVTLKNNDTQGIIRIWDKNESYPININIPNAFMVPELFDDKLFTSQIACFAESFEHFKTEDEFNKKYKDFMPKSFIPSGQFNLNKENDGEYPRAWINGSIKTIQLKTNSYTKKQYYHIVIESYNMDFDILLDAASVDSELCVGDILSVNAWLTGKLRNRYYGDSHGYIKRKKIGNSSLNTLNDLYNILRECWCKETAYPSCQKDWLPNDSSYGQCAVTAMLAYDMFGGTIHRIHVNGGGTHYFNKIDGHYIDLTSEQFDLYNIPVLYEPNEKIDRKYCGRNANTQKRYELLIKRIFEKINHKY